MLAQSTPRNVFRVGRRANLEEYIAYTTIYDPMTKGTSLTAPSALSAAVSAAKAQSVARKPDTAQPQQQDVEAQIPAVHPSCCACCLRADRDLKDLSEHQRNLLKGPIVTGRGYWTDYFNHVRNTHPFLSIFLVDPVHPYDKRERFIAEFTVTSYVLLIAALANSAVLQGWSGSVWDHFKGSVRAHGESVSGSELVSEHFVGWLVVTLVSTIPAMIISALLSHAAVMDFWALQHREEYPPIPLLPVCAPCFLLRFLNKDLYVALHIRVAQLAGRFFKALFVALGSAMVVTTVALVGVAGGTTRVFYYSFLLGRCQGYLFFFIFDLPRFDHHYYAQLGREGFVRSMFGSVCCLWNMVACCCT